MPTTQQLEAELRRVKTQQRNRSGVKRVLGILVVVAAAAILLAVYLLPVMRIYGNSMEPVLKNGDVAVAVKHAKIDTGDVIAFTHHQKVLVKRVIGRAGDWIDIDSAGVVTVNGTELEEPYLVSKALGQTDITLPYQVPDGSFFVMGDLRETSMDSRSTEVGCVRQEQIIGKVFLRIWPLKHIGRVR